jgi:hypothetical protein
MKKVIKLIIQFLVVVISFSCEENFSPKTDFVQQYALFCIIDGDTTYQRAIIEKSYNVEGLDPSGYTGNPFIKDADIKLIYNNIEYPLKDSVSVLNGEEFDFYYTDSLKPEPDKVIEISAVLQGGETLTGRTITPKSANLSFQFEDLRSDTYIEQKESGLFFIWHINGENSEGILYLPKLEINYYRLENGINVAHRKEVPLSYFENSGQYLPNYPIVTSENTLNYQMEAINRAMNEISDGDPDKSNYTILDAEFELLLLDNNLAPYYLSIQTFLDGYTVILDQMDYSNIEGGFGILGSFFRRVNHLSFSRDYVMQFGYRLAND